MFIGEWAVAGILLALSVIFIATAVIMCRVFGVRAISSWFAAPDEKSYLTRSDQLHSYMVTSESEVNMPSSGGYMTYDTLVNDPKYLTLTSEQQDTVIESPVSVDSVSTTSDFEPVSSLPRAMSCESLASDSSILDIEPDVPKIGQLEFGLEYDREVSELIISVIQARDLEHDEVTGTVDSYVKLWLTPHKGGVVQTKVQKNSTDPVYKERFLFNVESLDLAVKTLQLQVYSSDKYARNKLLGETDLRLGDLDIRNPIRIWMNLRDMDEKPSDYGDVMFSLSYLPTAERLTIVLVKARNAKWSNGKETANSFIKVYLLQNGKKIGKKKTSIKRDEKNPLFNEAMIFSVPSSMLQTVQLRLRLMEQHPDGHASAVGHVIIGSQLSGTQLTHWKQMLASLRKPVAMWHQLKK